MPVRSIISEAIARAMADPRRFAIVKQVAAAAGAGLPCSMLEVHEAISAATVSHHMKELSEAGLIATQREGRGANLFLRREVWDAYLKRLAVI